MSVQIPPIFSRNPQPFGDQNVYFHHKVELIRPQQAATNQPVGDPTLMDRVRSAVANTLIVIGALLALTASVAMTLQASGAVTGICVTCLSNFMMPSIAAILTGFHLAKNEVSVKPTFQLDSGIPGVGFST